MQWIQVNLRSRRRTRELIGIKVWAVDNQDAIRKANRVIDYKKWYPESAGPTNV